MSLKFQYPRLPINESVEIYGKKFPVSNLPKGLKVMDDVGLAGVSALEDALMYRAVKSLFEVRGTITPGGDYLVMFPAGEHFGALDKKGNTMMALRSNDKGQTWSNPYIAFKNIDYNQHAFIPYIPKGSKRIYSYCTQPVWGLYTRNKGSGENAPLGCLYSDDDGYTWKGPELIFPVNAPEFNGISVMRLCETKKGTLLYSACDNLTNPKPFIVSQFILRSTDQGKSWTVIPEYHGPGSGWNFRPQRYMGEGVPFQIGDRVIFLLRAPTGVLWAMWSDDDGITWTNPEPTPVVHPDAPPMGIILSDKKTLMVLHHYRGHKDEDSGRDWDQRSEVWVTFSTDCGKTWSESSFLFCNAARSDLDNHFFNSQCSYIDMFIDGDTLNLFVPHRWQQVVHLKIKEKELFSLPKKSDLGL